MVRNGKPMNAYSLPLAAKIRRDTEREIFHDPVLRAIQWAAALGIHGTAIRSAVDRHNELCREREVSEMDCPVDLEERSR